MLKPSHHHRWIPALVCVAALALLAPAAALAADRGRPQPASTPTRVIPVWAYVNGANPVAGGRVTIMAGGKPVRQLRARTSGVTNVNGVALVLVRRVPRRYTVVVRGGRVAGERLPGGLRSLAVSGAGVAEVNPLTALVSQLRGQRPSPSFSRASRLVKHYFGVPWWADLGDNLRDGPAWFSAAKYLAEARRYGSTDRLNRAVALRILHAGSRFPHIPDGTQLRMDYGAAGSSSAAKTATTAAGLRDLTSKQLVGKVFKHLLETGLRSGSRELVGGLLGGLLALASQATGITPPKSEFEQVQDQLNAIGAQLTELKGQVANLDLTIAKSDASRLLHLSDKVIGDIQRGSEDLEALAASTRNANGQKQLAEDIAYHVRNTLLTAPKTFEALLDPAFTVANNPIKAVSHVLGSSGFFDAQKSDEVRTVYEYYATYQTELAVLLTNYWNTKPDAYPVAAQKAEIAKLDASVTKIERESLKPTVPAGTFIDTRTPAFMWGMYSQSVTALTVINDKQQTSTKLHLGGFHNYQMPSFHDYKNLLKGATGDPRVWLQGQVKVSLDHQLVWGSEGITTRTGFSTSPYSSPPCEVRVDIFNLDKDAVQSAGRTESGSKYNCRTAFTDPKIENFLRSKSGGLLLLRYLAPGERYYW
ncbi:MAG: hypothetical protein WAL22_24025 [Solirubrobacteraceae bacterium]